MYLLQGTQLVVLDDLLQAVLQEGEHPAHLRSRGPAELGALQQHERESRVGGMTQLLGQHSWVYVFLCAQAAACLKLTSIMLA